MWKVRRTAIALVSAPRDRWLIRQVLMALGTPVGPTDFRTPTANPTFLQRRFETATAVSTGRRQTVERRPPALARLLAEDTKAKENWARTLTRGPLGAFYATCHSVRRGSILL